MPATIVGTVTYNGTIIRDRITTSPWSCYGMLFADRGGIPVNPQFVLELLQPENLDGARYRVGGAHFPVFKLIAVLSATDYPTANALARNVELSKGDSVVVDFSFATAPMFGDGVTCMVIDVIAKASPFPILAALANNDGLPPDGSPLAGTATASVDVMWTLQKYIP